MPKTRQLKHDFFLDEGLAARSLRARLLFAGLWLLADREGRLEDRPAKIKAQLFPYDDVDLNDFLTELDGEFIHRYEVDGVKCLVVAKFKKHQHIHPDEKLSDLPPRPKSIALNPRKSPEIMHIASVPSPTPSPTPSSSAADAAKCPKLKQERKTVYPHKDCQEVVSAYLEASGKGGSDIAKDPGGWGRWIIEADKLLAELGGRVDLAQECITERAKDWKGVSDWTMAGVARRAKDWLAEKQAGAR